MVCSVKEFLDQAKTGSVTAVNTKKIRYKGVVCDRCGVEVTKASVRRERMDILPWQPRYLISGTLKESRAVWD